jgi:GNAT superfamily N-acetyltransferase
VTLYRHFRNSDPPKLAALWRECTQFHGLLQPMTVSILENLVFNKAFFDAAGLIVAEDDGRIIGYVHAGFGPVQDESRLDEHLGVTSMLLVHPGASWSDVAPKLLAESEQYLLSHGAKILCGGSLEPVNPFYLGLYGGSELPGILDSDQWFQDLYRQHGYSEVDRVMVFQRELGASRPVIDRRHIQIRRRTQVAIVEEPPLRTWWEACVLAQFDRQQFQLLDSQMGNTLAVATLRSLDPPFSNMNTGSYGLMDLFVEEKFRHQGYASFLLNEILNSLTQAGCISLEAQTMQANSAAIGMYNKLGFHETNRGRMFRKEIA